MKNLLLRWAFISLFCCSSAQADIRFERFLPVNPTSDYAPTVELWFSGDTLADCDYVGTPISRVADSVLVSGNTIRMQIPVHHEELCVTFVPLFPPHTWRYPLARLPAGSYTLEIIGRNVSTQPFGGPTFNITSVPLVIGAGSLVDVPFLTGWGLGLLVFVILVFGARGRDI